MVPELFIDPSLHIFEEYICIGKNADGTPKYVWVKKQIHQASITNPLIQHTQQIGPDKYTTGPQVTDQTIEFYLP